LASEELFANYAEALAALSTVEARHREALRKAVEASAATENQAKSEMANQQRMYDRAGKDAIEAERHLAELRTMLGIRRDTLPGSSPSAGMPPPLAQIRAHIGEISQWATESVSTAESLLRTRERLRRAPRPTPPPPALPIDREATRAKKPAISTRAVIAVLITIATLTVIVLAIA
jgi:hypothetical protein